MEYWIVVLVTIGIVSVDAQTNNFEFKYYEDTGGPEVHQNVSLVGSYVNLGPYPHWCLGNLDLCQEGYGLNLWVKFHSVREDTPGIIVFTTGGHSSYSSGIYLLQRYGNEYEFGTVFEEFTWKVNFHLLPDMWLNLQAIWHPDDGLTVHIDGASYSDFQPSTRDYLTLEFDPFPDVVFGIDLNETPHTISSRFEVRSLSVYNWTAQEFDPPANEDELLWLGCQLGDRTETYQIFNQTAAVTLCRAYCRSKGSQVAMIQNNLQCDCTSLSDLQEASQDSTTCSRADAWNCYVVTALSPSAGFRLSVSVFKLGVHEYVKPFEAVLIQITANFRVDVPYLLDLGDGTEQEISGRHLSYFWESAGKYKITVQTNVGVSTITANTTFTVEDIDEGTPGDFVMISAYQDNSESMLGLTRMVSMDHELHSCSIDFLEDNITTLEYPKLESYVEDIDTEHTFSLVGSYGITAVCENPYGITRNQTDFTAQKLETTFHFHKEGTPFITHMAGHDSFFNDVTITHNNDSIPLPLHTNATQVTIYPDELQLHENFITFKFRDTVVDTRILHVQNTIEKPSIRSDHFEGAWNLTTNITIRVPAGNNIFLNLSFGGQGDHLFYLHYLPQITDIVFEVEFSDLGFYPVIAYLSNDISSNLEDALVSVEVPIETMTLTLHNITDKTLPVQLQININNGIQGPARVRFDVDHGDGVTRTYSHTSDTFYFTKFLNDHIYANWGYYLICVTAHNEISSITDCVPVQVGQLIKYVDIHMPSAGRFAVDETMTLIIRCPRGSDKTYAVDFDNGETFVFTDRYLKETENFETTTTTIQVTTPLSTTMAVMNTTENMNSTTSSNMNSTSWTSLDSTTGYNSSTGSTTTATTFTQSTTTPPGRRKRAAGDTVTSDSPQSETSATSTSTQGSTKEMSTEAPTTTDTNTPSNSNETVTTGSTTNGTNDTTTASFMSSTTSTTEQTTQTTTESTTTTTTTTTTMATTTTMEPLPDDAVDPYTTNSSTARRRIDGSIVVTHRYASEGVYTVRVRALNDFNWDDDTLCPHVSVSNSNVSSCKAPRINPGSYASSLNTPMHFIRSVGINLTATVSLGSSCSPLNTTYSWKAVKLVEEDGVLVERPVGAICSLETGGKVLKIPPVSLMFGLYKVTLTVSPAGHPLNASMQDFYFNVNKSKPFAIIENNNEHRWFLVYATTIIKFHRSVDPDFNSTNNLQYDLVCMDEKVKSPTARDSRETLISKSSLVTEGVTFKYTSNNPIRLYEFGSCFAESANISKDVRFPKGEFQVPSEYFSSDVSSFALRLFVTNDNLTTSADMTFEVRLSNASSLLDQLDDLLKSKDTTGVMRAVEALSASLIGGDSGNGTAEDFDKKEEVTNLKTKLINALDSVSAGVKDIGQASGMLGLVGDLTKDTASTSDSARVGATSAIKNSAQVTEEFVDEPLESLEGIGQQVVSGVGNVLPKEDENAKKLAEHEKALAKAEKDAAAAQAAHNGETDPESEGADIVIEEEEEEEEEIDPTSNEPLPYNKLLKRCDLLHSRELDKLYKYLMYYESIFRFTLKNNSEATMIDAAILTLNRNDIFCYLGVLEEPEDIEWYVNRFCDDEKRKRDLIRKNADRDVSKSFLGAIDSVSGVLLNKTEGNQTVSLGAPGLNVAMKKVSANDSESDSEAITSPTGGGVQMPKSVLAASSGNDSAEVGQTMIVNDQSPFTYGEGGADAVGTSVLTLKYTTPGTKDEIKVENSTEPVFIYLASDPSKLGAPSTFVLVVENGDVSKMNVHIWNNTKNDTSFHCMVRPLHNSSGSEFTIMIQYEEAPNDTHYLEMGSLPHPEGSFPNAVSEEQDDILRHTFFPDTNLTAKAGIYKIGVRIKEARMDFTESKQRYYYSMQWYQGGCKFWNAENETWDADGCEVGNRTTPNQTECMCTHLTSFGGDMVVPPNTIDFSNVWSKFKNLDENAAVFATIISLLGVYVILLIWARYMDKKDIIKWGATPLEDNLPTDTYHYQMSVSTGVRKKAGTSSNISLIVSGETCDTGVRRMFDGKRKKHDIGSIMNYILSTEKKLGPLNYLRVWHDNSGEGNMRSWFLDQIEVTDLQTGERYFFLNNRWLACEEDDGMVDRIIPVAGIEDLVAFKQLFSSSVRKKLASDHLWLSVFSRPTRSKFTRVQRISCCMSLLFLTMITNAMWFKGDSDKNSNQTATALKIGPIQFTLQQVFISLMSTVIVFPPSFLLVTLFRRSKQKKNTIIQANQRMPKRGKWRNVANNNSHSEIWGRAPKTPKFQKFKESIQELLKGSGSKSKYDAGDEEENEMPAPTIAGDPDSKKKAAQKKKKPMMFPFWCNYIAWILCFFSVIAPAFFTILYSMEWGKEKANEWLVTFVLSFFQSVIVVQPIKVLCLVAFIACVLKKPDLDEDGDCSDELNNAIAAHDEELTTKGQDVIDEIAERRRKANTDFEPPDEEKLAASRENRLKEMKMEEILKEIMVYGFFVLVLFFLSYQQRDRQSFFFHANMKDIFLGKFEKIMTVLDYWKWLETVLMPALYVAKFHNGSSIEAWWDKRCIYDFESRRMGIARLRQMRIKEDTCTIAREMRPVINHCRNDYNWFDDDGAAYMPDWKEPDERNATILEDLDDANPWVYQSSVKLANAPYMATLQTYKGGGYVVNFERSYRRTVRNLTRLRSENWLDLRTRVIFLEFTVYNPNANLFASAIMTTEFPATGAAVPRSEFKVFRLQSYVGGFAIVVIFFEILYCCFILFFFVRCIKKVKKLKCKYFNNFWDILEFILLCFAVTCIAMYAFKHILTEVAFNSLKNQSKAEYVNFQSLALYDEMYGYMTAFVVFVASIQFLKLLQFNQKMNMLGDTVKLATKDLKVFSIAFILYFSAFVMTGYLLFGQYIQDYNGVIQAAESTFAFTLGSFDFGAMSGAQAILGPLFFFAFIAVIYVGMMSIFLTIIADAFTTIKEQVGNKKNEYEMMDFIWRKFKGIIGVK